MKAEYEAIGWVVQVRTSKSHEGSGITYTMDTTRRDAIWHLNNRAGYPKMRRKGLWRTVRVYIKDGR